MSIQYFKKEVLNLHKNPAKFNDLALEIFQYQAQEVPCYRDYLGYLKIDPQAVKQVEQIPYLPIEAFKHHVVTASSEATTTVFQSSGTTGQITSKHYVQSPEFYIENAKEIFENRFGPLASFNILGLLPSYLERGNSSLVYMVQHFVNQSKPTHHPSHFFLNNHQDLYQLLTQNAQAQQPTILFGVTFALLDFVETYALNLRQTPIYIIETGGMKGRGKDLLKPELHQLLQQGFGTPNIYSEYGMTELLSQAYTNAQGLFETPATMRLSTRDLNDPFTENKKYGQLCIIDLANIESCCFIETQDLAKIELTAADTTTTQTFEILGRIDYSELRGCSQMVL